MHRGLRGLPNVINTSTNLAGKLLLGIVSLELLVGVVRKHSMRSRKLVLFDFLLDRWQNEQKLVERLTLQVGKIKGNSF